MTFGHRLKLAREMRDMTQAQLAEHVRGLSQQAIANAENRGSKSSQYLLEIAKVLRVHPQWLSTGQGSAEEPMDTSHANLASLAASNAATRQYPLISHVQAGIWSEATDIYQPGDADKWLPSPKDLGVHGFVLEVKGESMTNPQGSPNFPEGILLFINPEIGCQPNDYVIAKREAENEVTFKQLKLIDGKYYLHAINPNWPVPYIEMQSGDRLCGRVAFAGFAM